MPKPESINEKILFAKSEALSRQPGRFSLDSHWHTMRTLPEGLVPGPQRHRLCKSLGTLGPRLRASVARKRSARPTFIARHVNSQGRAEFSEAATCRFPGWNRVGRLAAVLPQKLCYVMGINPSIDPLGMLIYSLTQINIIHIMR